MAAKKTSLKKRGILDGYKTYDTSQGFGDPGQWRRAFQFRLGIDVARSVVGDESPRSILGVDAKASWRDIRKAYRTLVLSCHPDMGGNVDVFRKIQAAYEILEEDHLKGKIK